MKKQITIRTVFTSRFVFLAIIWLCGSVGLTGTVFAQDSIGEINTMAYVPPIPGFPEGVAVSGNHIYVSGPATFGTAGTGPSAVHVFDRKTGLLVTTINVVGEVLAFEHALSNVAVDGQDRIYALSTQLGLIRFRKQDGIYIQESYGNPLPDLPRCADVGPGTACSPTALNFPPIPNDVVFDNSGFAYVTDSLQATVFRYAPGGGSPQIWFQSPLFEGGGFMPFGPNGIRLDPGRQRVYIVVSTSASAPNVGTIYSLPLVNVPSAASLQVFYTYINGEVPDQLAFDNQGNLYVSLALTNQISVLAPNGTELTRYQSALGDEIPLDAPAGIAFDSRTKSLLIANHAIFSANPAHYSVLRLYTGNPGNPLDTPVVP
jgi:sugar lactone lactonase YvrE